MRGWVLGAILAVTGCGSAHHAPATSPTPPQPATTTTPPTTTSATTPGRPPGSAQDDPIDDADVLPLDGTVATKPHSPQEQPMSDPFGPPPGQKPKLAPKGRLGNDSPPKHADCRKKPERCGVIDKL